MPTSKVKEVAAMSKRHPCARRSRRSKAKGRASCREVERDEAGGCAAALVVAGIEETLYYYTFPREHSAEFANDNRLERLLREGRRRTERWERFPTAIQRLMSSAAARPASTSSAPSGARAAIWTESPHGRVEAHDHPRKDYRLPLGGTGSRQGSRTDENRGTLEKANIYTVKPKGIVVIGSLLEVKDDLHKLQTFERIRRSINGVEILTFDEL